MSPFNNKEVDETGMPPEVHQFYQAEHRERVGVAWLLAFVTLVITVGIALGGFSGGRAIYRKITKDDKKTTTSQVATKNEPATTSAPSNNQSAANNPQPNNTNDSSSNNQPATPSTPTPSPTPTTPTPVTTPAPAPTANSDLPGTGPASTLSIFISVTLVATLGHMIYTRYKLSKETI